MSLTQINKAGLDEIALDHVFTIGASGSSAYTFQGEGLNGTVNNPTLYLTRGKTYRFENGSGGHPIRIQSTSGASGTAYNTGVTNNAGSGTVIVEVQHDAPDVLYYQCTSHAAMNGILYITGALADGGVTTAKIADSAVTTAKIADQAVTLAKLPHGTSSNDGKFLRANNGADPSFETVSIPAGTTINNNADNRVITGSGTANTLNGESNVNIDSSGRLLLATTSASGANSGADDLVIGNTSQGNNGMTVVTNAANNGAFFFADQDGTVQGGIRYQHGADLAQFYAGGNVVLNLKNKGVGINETSPTEDSLTIRGADTNDTPLLILKRHSDGDTTTGEVLGKIQFISNENNVDSGNPHPRVALHAVQVNNAGAAKLEFYTVPNFTTNAVKTMTLNQEGRLCIGTDDAVAKLNVVHSSSDTSPTGSGTLASCISVSNTNTTNNNFAGIVMGDRTDSQDFVGAMLTKITDHTQNYGHIEFYTNGSGGRTEKLRIQSNGGISFNGDTATANALDDYEEGTFTPSFNMTGGGHSLTYSLQQGSYTKIGNVVSVEIYLSVTGVNANGSGNLRIGGLPFTKTARYGGLNISYLYGINNIEISHALVDVNTNQIYLYKVQPSSSNYHTTTISIAEAFTTSTQIMLNGIYLAA